MNYLNLREKETKRSKLLHLIRLSSWHDIYRKRADRSNIE